MKKGNKTNISELVSRMKKYEEWRRGETDAPMSECVPSMEQWHEDQRKVFDLLLRLEKEILLSREECGNCKPSVPCENGCLVYELRKLVGEIGKPRRKKGK